MKYISWMMAAIFAMLVSGTAYADNTDGCYWFPNESDKRKKVYNFTPAASKQLNMAAVGGRMAYQSFNIYDVFKCPLRINRINFRFSINAPLEEGYENVFRTNVPGVGIRFVDSSRSLKMPYESGYNNAAAMGGTMPAPLNMELVRTNRDVKTGKVDINFKIVLKVQDWEAAEINFVGPIDLTSSNYFSGCTGEKRQDISLGQVAIPLMDQQVPRNIGLNVLCTGLLPGSKLPVRIYFEGSNAGPGMLNLTPGGAEGIGIALTTPAGEKLSFTSWPTLPLKWVNSEEGGERYTFEFNAKYARKGSEKMTPGKADAVLNYILNYN
ncbi:fimbrial protein [Pseudomonas parafulva]|uniref:fimbrial protein n=1 Tax=Pseudomonas parafulva TaxID=157782 RepID=UPI003565B703